ncbi:MAG: PfkB family carbohydrate kinase [Candidatus Micrarchaeota archaeon]
MIVCAGSIAFDTTHTPFKSVRKELGGTASYFGVASSFFTKTGLVSTVGTDFTQKYWSELSKRCDLSGVERRKGNTFSFESKFGFDLEDRKFLGLKEGVFEKGKWIVPESFKNAGILFLNTHHLDLNERVYAQAKAENVFLDIIEYLIKSQKREVLKFLRKTRGFIINEMEARILEGETNLIKAGKAIQRKGPEIVVIKKGEHGGLLFFENDVFPFPAFPLENVVDPTGAGDGFAGGFAGWLDKKGKISEKSLRKACSYGTVMASFCVEDFGLNKLLKISKGDVEKRLKEYERLTFA